MLAPLSRWTDAIVLAARLIVGVVMLYHDWPKIRDPLKERERFPYDLLLLALCLPLLARAYRV